MSKIDETLIRIGIGAGMPVPDTAINTIERTME